jgi:ketosteroid isomerase-like protein
VESECVAGHLGRVPTGVEEVIEDGDSVVALIHIQARGKGSGVQVDVRFYAQIKVRDGKIVYIYDHEDREAALEAAGLSE